MPTKSQASFTGGEIGEALHERSDLEKYHTSVKTMENKFCHAYGGASNRAGLEYIARSISDTEITRVIPFSFSTVQTYALVFSNLKMRVIRNGGLVLETAQNVTGLTQADPGVVTITGHGFSNGDWVYSAGLGGMTAANFKFYIVANVTANTFELTDLEGDNVDTTGYDAYTSGGTFARVYTVTTPYAEADLFRLKYTQSADVMTLTHVGYDARELSRTGHSAWTFTTVSFASEVATPSGSSGAATTSGSTTFKYQVTAIAEETFEESLPEDITVSSAATPVTSTDTIVFNIASVSGAARYNIYKQRNGGLYGYVGSTKSTGASAFTDDGVDPDLEDTPPETRDPFAGGNAPGTAIYHEQRRIFAGSTNDPQVFWGTQIGNYYNMNVSFPSKTADAVTYRMGSSQVNEIRHLVALRELFLFCSDAEWRAKPGDTNNVISGSNPPDVKPQSVVGVSHVPPLLVKNQVIYLQDGGKKVYDFGYKLDIDGYDGNELSILAYHMFELDGVIDWTYAKEPDSIVWCVREDGVMLGMTYLKEHGVSGWHRHVTAGEFESVCSIKEGDEDAVYVVVKRTIGGVEKKFIERKHTRKFLPLVEDAFFVDAGLSLDVWNTTVASTMTLTGGTNWTTDEDLTLTENGTSSPFTSDQVGDTIFLRTFYTSGKMKGNIEATVQVVITAYISATVVTVNPVSLIPTELRGVATNEYAFAITSITGMDHLAGEEVEVFADGLEEPTGAITAAGGFTFARPVAVAHIGLGYDSTLETLDIDFQTKQGSTQTKKKRVPKVNVSLKDSKGFWAGPTDDIADLTEMKRDVSDYNNANHMNNGRYEISVEPTWSETGHVVIKHFGPSPITITAIRPEVEVE